MLRCGFAKDHPAEGEYHETTAQVVLCSRRHYAAKAEREIEAAHDAETQADAAAEQAAELAYERHLEDRGGDEAALQDAMEARQGVIPFDEALRLATEEVEAGLALGRVSGVEPVTSLVDTRSVGPSRQERRHPRVDWKAIAAIPVGGRGAAHYALVVDDEVKFYLVERSDSGKWAGRTFAKVQAGPAYHRMEKGAQIGVLGRIAADPLAAAKLYAKEVGQCSQCNSPLTDDESRARGMGPICAGRFGGAA